MLIAVAPVAAILVFLHATAAANMSLIVLACLGTQIIDNFLVLLQGRSPDQNRGNGSPAPSGNGGGRRDANGSPDPSDNGGGGGIGSGGGGGGGGTPLCLTMAHVIG